MDNAIVLAACALAGWCIYAALVRPVLWKLNVC